MILQTDRKPCGVILDLVSSPFQQEPHEQALKNAESAGSIHSSSLLATLDDAVGTDAVNSSVKGVTFPSDQEEASAPTQMYSTGELNGRVCQVSISHDGDYAVATAMVYDEGFETEN
jgi:hypothetical protein